MSEVEIAEALGISQRTVSREWQKARALLLTLIGEKPAWRDPGRVCVCPGKPPTP